MKKMISYVLALSILLGVAVFCVPATAQAASSNKPVIARIEYEGGGKVEVDFKSRVSYNSVKVSVKDSGGKAYSAKILERDSDELDFKINSVQSGKTYTFTISGIKRSGTSGYTSVSGSVKVPSAAKITIGEVEYDAEDRELSVEFAHRVHYKNTKVTIKDSSGKSYSVRIREKENDEMELYASGLKRGKRYTLTISGIKCQSVSTYTSVSKAFTA